jgi:hypothetical protein
VHTEEPDDYTHDIIWIDRVTGNVVLRYDGADPANTRASRGAITDEEVFRRRGMDLNEEVEIRSCVVPVDPREPAWFVASKARKTERGQEEAEARNLLSFLGDAAEGFDFEHWSKGEADILEPALEARGFTQVGFYMGEEDSFGPLSRGCFATDPEGKRVRF